MKPGIHVRFIEPIAPTIRKLVTSLAAAAEAVTPIRHALKLHVVPAPAVQAPDGQCGFGVFVLPTCEIYMAGDPPAEVGDDVEEFLRSTLAHELAHYEQHRDGKPLQERGVAVRTRTLEARMVAAGAG